jgi:hypothetical protein
MEVIAGTVQEDGLTADAKTIPSSARASMAGVGGAEGEYAETASSRSVSIVIKTTWEGRSAFSGRSSLFILQPDGESKSRNASPVAPRTRGLSLTCSTSRTQENRVVRIDQSA